MNAMKIASIVTGIILIVYAMFSLIWLWSESISWEIFVKTSITAAVVVVAVVGSALLYREYVEERKMKQDKYLD